MPEPTPVPDAPPRPRRCTPGDWLEEPYRLFFPLGTLWSLAGALYWVLGGALPGWGHGSPEVHVWIQTYGFVGCFVLGFLTTALPRITRTGPLHGLDVGLLLVLSQVALLGVLAEAPGLAHGAWAGTLALLAIVLIPRVVRTARPLPPTFAQAGVAALAGLVGAVLLAAQAMRPAAVPEPLGRFARQLAIQGLPVLMLTGVGGYLIRSIVGWLAPSDLDVATPRAAGRAGWTYAATGLAVLAALAVECTVHAAGGAAAKAALVTAMVAAQFRVHRAPRSDKLGSRWLRVAAALLVVGFWCDAGAALWAPRLRIALLHLCFAGGFGISILVVASRVVYAHGGFASYLRRRVVPVNITLGLVLLAVLTRASADFLPRSYASHLVYAAAAWCLALLVWCATVLFRVGLRNPDADAC